MEISDINNHFLNKARGFILIINQINNKPIPHLNDLSEDEIIKIHAEERNKLMEELMWHRNNPVPVEKLKELKLRKEALPLSIIKVLESL